MIQRYLAANMISSLSISQADAVNLAKAYDVISAEPRQFGADLPAMRAANPNLIVLGYMNGTFTSANPGPSVPVSWYLHDNNGHTITSVGYGNHLMDPTNPGWIANRQASCTQLIASGYDGCLVDMLGTAPLIPHYLTGLPVDPATGVTYTTASWVAATARLSAAIAMSVAPRVVVGNGLVDGTRYFDPTAPTAQLLDGLSGAMGESWLKGPRADSSYPTPSHWKQNVDALVDAGRRGRSVVALTKTWGSGTAAQKDAWHVFALASFLLGTDGRSYFSFSSANTTGGTAYDSPWEHADVGQPTGAYTRNSDGSYQRLFTTGEAMVNPTPATVTLTPPQAMCDLNGIMRSRVTLGPDGAQVLTSC
ncbi:MAG: putative glycoside hydrolase [Acidimicrobiales bacterium]